MNFKNEFEMTEEELRGEVNNLRNQRLLLQTQHEALEKELLLKAQKDKLELRRHRENLMSAIFMEMKKKHSEYISNFNRRHSGPMRSFDDWLIEAVKVIEKSSKKMEEQDEGKT